jgi:hypothetical protein
MDDGRIKGRAADGIFMLLDGDSNLDVSDRQAVKRGKAKLRDVLGEDYRMWG